MGMIWARECMNDFLTYQDATDGSIYICFASNNDLYEKYPTDEGIIRADCPIAGWILTPDPQNSNRCHCLLIAEC